MERRVMVVAFVLWGGLFQPLLAGAGDAPRGVVEPRANRVLRSMGAHLMEAQEFTFEVEASHEVVFEGGQKIQYGTTSRVAARRPDGVWARTQGDRGRFRMWYDGRRVTLLDEDRNEYSSVKVPDTIDEAFDALAGDYGITPPLVDLLYSDLYGLLREGAETGIYVGMSEVRGARCHHIAVTYANIDWQVWVEDGLAPLPRKVVIDYKSERGRPQYAAFLSEWNVEPDFAADLFSYSLPEDAELVPLPTLKEQVEKGAAQ